jgi:hypothetical protein
LYLFFIYTWCLFCYFLYILGAKNSVREQRGPPIKGRKDSAPRGVLLDTAGLQPPALNLFEKGEKKNLSLPWYISSARPWPARANSQKETKETKET